MRKFIIKLIYFFFLPLLILLCTFFEYPILDNEILNDSLESKISELKIDTADINIVIAGDSRAERQLIPKIIIENTGINTINIATTSCDLVTVVGAIKKKYQSYSKFIFVISASSWQVNDGAIDPGYLSLKSFQKLNILEKFGLYRKYIPEMIWMQKRLLKASITKLLKIENIVVYDKKTIRELGFAGIEGNLKVQLKNTLEKEFISHSWYKNNNNSGLRWTLFQKSLCEIGNMNSIFIIYQPPVSPYWKINTAKSFIDIAEIQYSEKLAYELQYSKNILLFDFYTNEINELNDSMYYDYQHLNRQGAEIFSVLLSKKILAAYQNKFNK